MPDLNAIRENLKKKRDRQAEKERELIELRGKLRRLNEQVKQLNRAGVRAESDGRNLREKHVFQLYERTTAQLRDAIIELRDIRSAVHEVGIARGDVPSREAIRLFSDSLPLLLFPVRIETKFMRDLEPQPQLWVRIYPDEIAIETHERPLTQAEFEGGAQYYRDAWPALVDPPPTNALEIRKAAWRRLVDGYGSERSAWILRVIDEERFVLNLQVEEVDGERSYKVTESTPRFKVTEEALLFSDDIVPDRLNDLNSANVANIYAAWAQKFEEAGFSLSDNLEHLSVSVIEEGEQWEAHDAIARQTYRVVRKEGKLAVWVLPVPIRPESWSEAPRSHVLPDRFMVRLYRGNGLVYEAEGVPVPHPLIVGPTPFPLEETADNNAPESAGGATGAFFDEESAWVADFDRAVEFGMGLRIDLTHPEDLTQGFSRVIVLGIKASADADESAAYLQNLVESHYYTEGFAFVRQGTATNNTSEARAGYSSQESSDESFARIHGSSTSGPDADGPRLASGFGIPASVFERAYRADGTENRNAERILEALWSATWAYYFELLITLTPVA